ncbi:baeRF8 domain-containing protein [Companilactobacillus nodensis]|uniref:Bacterial archaeo-eukaryotic release factor family 8 domain-containing protein n=1 Tax=Companilactobacillus nodensis DSM 19682 = JCM 14932 = NBRC 107160 TaxID=1423775 RepID=A0A0R1KDW1_9LACO|nr:hypothetical protein [Companilactobacillus nodensis]KRK79715.1 hypothetical protein FD03_GL000416 [Companilactobacillus nodensis DSM 19682 = JCM 14932 = NBRC 107160]
MKITIQKELLQLLSSNVEPKISIILPIHPENPQVENNILTYKNLLKDVKKDLELNYSRRDWSNVVSKLENLILDRNLWNSSNQSLLIFANNEDLQICELNHAVQPKAHVGSTFLIQDLFSQEELSNKPQYIINLSRDRINVIDIASLKAIEFAEIHTSFSDYYSDFDANSNLNTGSYGGLNGSYHGHRTKSEEQQKDQLIYYRYLDRELSKMHKEQGFNFIIAGLPEILDNYLNSYGNSSYIYDVIHGSVINISQRDLANKIEEIFHDQKLIKAQSLMKEYNQADRQDKVLNDVDSIAHALNNERVKSLISFNSGDSYSVDQNKLMLQAALNKIHCRVIETTEKSDLPTISAIVY